MIPIDLEGRIALVTGGSRGIGAVIVRTLARAGARVALHYGRSSEAARAVAAEVERDGGIPPLLSAADLARENERRRLFQDVTERLGAPAILVNNAGIYVRNPFEEPDDAAFLGRWRTTLAVNLEAAAHLSLLSLPSMRQAGFGRIVMVSSRAAFRAETDFPDYAVSKAGMVSLARCLARNEGPHGITANSVCPGWIETEMATAEMGARRAEIVRDIPLGRVGTPEDVADAVLFLVSPLGSYLNGAALPLNGGSFLH
jgi:NAD(P)-dependent dehydrogenase (short-subunit alcohol dehydrogenase family)